MNWSDFTKGLVVGAVTGAIGGVLFAPKSGKETRQEIKDYASDIKENVSEKISDLGQVTRDKYNAIVDAVVGSYEDAKKISGREAEEMRRDLRKNYAKIRNTFEE
jgi:gas vesicle protein